METAIKIFNLSMMGYFQVPIQTETLAILFNCAREVLIPFDEMKSINS